MTVLNTVNELDTYFSGARPDETLIPRDILLASVSHSTISLKIKTPMIELDLRMSKDMKVASFICALGWSLDKLNLIYGLRVLLCAVSPKNSPDLDGS
jgi:hypothetical protein